MQRKHNLSEIAIIPLEDLQDFRNELASIREELYDLRQQTVPAKRHLTYEDVAKMTGYKVGYLKQLVHYQKIPSVRIGRSVRFERKAIEQWIDGAPSTAIETAVANHLVKYKKQ